MCTPSAVPFGVKDHCWCQNESCGFNDFFYISFNKDPVVELTWKFILRGSMD